MGTNVFFRNKTSCSLYVKIPFAPCDTLIPYTYWSGLFGFGWEVGRPCSLWRKHNDAIQECWGRVMFSSAPHNHNIRKKVGESSIVTNFKKYYKWVSVMILGHLVRLSILIENGFKRKNSAIELFYHVLWCLKMRRHHRQDEEKVRTKWERWWRWWRWKPRVDIVGALFALVFVLSLKRLRF